MSTGIQIRNLAKRYGDLTIIPDLSVEIMSGEFFTLLGPSGCGKTTLLRMIAGFNSIENGTIAFNNQVINHVPAHKRNIGMVFQNYAIFPHLSVRENVKYGLKLRKIPKKEMNERVDQILEVTQIKEYADRLPENLSGGQQQRVALARAIVVHPTVLLMDEPLSNLDAKLRLDMRSAIREIQKDIGITTVYVTHDQEEALAISDRIAVMNDGVIQQIGSPHTIYTRPANLFVGGFIGHSSFFAAKRKGNCVVFSDQYQVEMSNLVSDCGEQDVYVGVRPEEILISANETGIPAIVKRSTFLGRYIHYVLECQGCTLLGEHKDLEFTQEINVAERTYSSGDSMMIQVNTKSINVFSASDQTSLIEGVSRNV